MISKNKKGRPRKTSTLINIVIVIISRKRTIVNSFYFEANTLGGLLCLMTK